MEKPNTIGLDFEVDKLTIVDFIGGENPMTKEEEKAISEFIKMQKLLIAKKQIRGNKTTRQSKSIAESR